jgi:hypothetical protein
MRRIKLRSHFIFLFLFCGIYCLPAPAGDVALAWDSVSAINLAGYKVYYGTTSRSYTNSVSAGTQTTYTIPSSGMNAGKTYYFAVTALNTSGIESAYSNEASKTIPSCDTNSDSVTNVLDLQRLVNVILGTVSTSAAYDLNGDSSVSVLDLQLLSNVVLGLRSCP